MHGKITSLSMSTAGQGIVDSFGQATGSIFSTIKGILDNTVIPLSLLGLFISMLFVLISIVMDKRRGEADGLEEKVKALIVMLCVFVALAGYSVLWGGLLGQFIPAPSSGGSTR